MSENHRYIKETDLGDIRADIKILKRDAEEDDKRIIHKYIL